MTRDDDRKRIATDGGADGTHPVEPSDSAGEFAIRDRLAVRDILQRCPDRPLEPGAVGRVDGELERLTRAGGVLVELLDDRAERVGSVVPLIEVRCATWKEQTFQTTG